MKRLVLILGMYNSGNAMMAQLCQCMGAYLGEENEQIVDDLKGNEICGIDNEILHLYGQEWYSLDTLELNENRTRIEKIVERLKDNIEKRIEKSDMVVINDPRISVLLPLWEDVLNELDVHVSYIWVYRNPLEVAELLREKEGFSKSHSLLLWVYYNLSILKFLKGKSYLRTEYGEILRKPQVPKALSEIFGCKLSHDFECVLRHIVNSGYSQRNEAALYMQNAEYGLITDFYTALLSDIDSELDVFQLEKRYRKELSETRPKYVDYEVLENIQYLKEKQIIIYGAGNCGKMAAQILSQLGIHKYDFCDRDTHKQGTAFMEKKVFSMEELEKEKNLCVIIAIENEEVRKEIEQTVSCIKEAEFLSFFALKLIWKYLTYNSEDIMLKMETRSFWHKEVVERIKLIKNACNCPVLVYQGGKVASTTVSVGLKMAGVESAHLHDFFFKTDRVGELIIGDDGRDFVKNYNASRFQALEYVNHIKSEMKGKKIITLVREPIAVDLSLVFQWIGRDISEKYFGKQLKEGNSFLEAVSGLMVRIQGRLFNWFSEELKAASGIDVLRYPFDTEKGYALISENEIEILILKAEKLSQMTDIIREFVGNSKIELVNKNVGENKGYAHIYKEVKKRLELPKEYVEYYYRNNPYMDHFYSDKEKELFLSKWEDYIENGGRS